MGKQTLQVNIRSMSYPGALQSSDLMANIAFTAAAGKIVSLVGPSGAGKTTLLRMIAGLERRFTGEVLLGDRPVEGPSRRIQIVFQDNRLLPWKTVAQNVEFAIPNGGGVTSSAIVDRWLSATRLSSKIGSWPKNLSGGEEARVAFARAFVDPPHVLLLDEPFRNLDVSVKADIQRELLQAIEANDIIGILVSHSVEDAVLLSDSICLLTSKPMKIESVIENKIARPRAPTSIEVLNLVATITQRLISNGKH